jgi:hypothetical protein
MIDISVGRVAEVVECLSSKCEALGSNPCTTKTNKQIETLTLKVSS